MSRSAWGSAILLLGMTAGLTAVHPNQSRADLIKYDMLLKACSAKGGILLADCTGYVAGVADTLEEQHAICLPDHAELKSVRELVAGYVQSHHSPPETKAATAVGDALRTGYACKKP
jgi:hypothetical protein